MTLLELIQKVKEEHLDRDQLENYHTQLSGLYSQMQLEIADIEKKEAIFMYGKDERESVANRKISWKATPEGLRLIELKRYCLSTKEMLNSLKSRIYKLL